jgi:branched-chain amino acid aminotransferase
MALILFDQNIREKTQLKLPAYNDEVVVYEVVRVIDGEVLFLRDHLDRFYRSAQLTSFPIQNLSLDYPKLLKLLIDHTKLRAGNVRFSIVYDRQNSSNFYFLAEEIMASYPSCADYEQGVSTILVEAERTSPNAKVMQPELIKKINHELSLSGAYEALLVNRDGIITEGSRSNIFFILNNQIVTCPAEFVLEGITRKKTIEILCKNGINFDEKFVHINDLALLSGLFIAGTSPKVLPVQKINQSLFSPKNELMQKIMLLYNNEIERDIARSKGKPETNGR